MARSQKPPKLQAILDLNAAAAAGWAPSDLSRAFLDGGATLIQLRAKQMPSGALLQLAQRLVRLTEPYEARLIVNDRTDIAKMAGASGVHVGQDDLAPAIARDILGPDAIVGFSTHTAAQVRAAITEPISYVAIGPVFGTATKDTGYEAVGLERVAEAARLAQSLPVVAIGGITLETAPAVIAAGASCVAVIADLLQGNDPEARVRAYLQAL